MSLARITHTQKKNLFIHLTRSHFSLIAKTHVALGTQSLQYPFPLHFGILLQFLCPLHFGLFSTFFSCAMFTHLTRLYELFRGNLRWHYNNLDSTDLSFPVISAPFHALETPVNRTYRLDSPPIMQRLLHIHRIR